MISVTNSIFSKRIAPPAGGRAFTPCTKLPENELFSTKTLKILFIDNTDLPMMPGKMFVVDTLSTSLFLKSDSLIETFWAE